MLTRVRGESESLMSRHSIHIALAKLLNVTLGGSRGSAYLRAPSYLVFLLVAGFMISCKTTPPAPPTRETDWIAASASSPKPAEEEDTKILDIYVDDSGSMRGFAAAPDSNYRKLIGEMWNSAAASNLNWTTHRFSTAKTLGTRFHQEDVENADFYSAQDTPLTGMINRIADNLRSKPAHATLLISDLVQSDPVRDSVDLATALGQLSALHPQIKLIGYRSDFDGFYTPEHHAQGRTRIHIQASQDAPGRGRPFYVLLVTPTSNTMSEIQKFILNGPASRPLPPTPSGLQGRPVFDPTTPPETIVGVALTPEEHSPWSLASQSPISKDTPSRLSSGFQWVGPSSSTAEVTLPVTLKYASNLTLRDAHSIGIETYVRTIDNHASPNPAPITLPITTEFDTTPGRLIMHIQVRKPAPKTWDVYMLRLSAGEANLEVPSWIREWNTDNDADINDGNKTYLLSVLAQAMVNNITTKEICAEWVLKIGGGK